MILFACKPSQALAVPSLALSAAEIYVCGVIIKIMKPLNNSDRIIRIIFIVLIFISVFSKKKTRLTSLKKKKEN